MNAFNLIIIGDEILHGSRQDKHFAFFKSLLESRGLKLNQVQYLPDEPDLQDWIRVRRNKSIL